MKLAVGCDLEFKIYYNTTIGTFDGAEEYWVSKDPSHLIVWRENSEVIGYAIWHEINTEEHRKGDPRDKEDREMLEKLLGEKKDFIELHEVWLEKKYRGKSYGKKFFMFFEEFIENRGYDSIVYYGYHPAAIAICRKRGYKEAYGLELTGIEGKMQTCYVFCLSLKRNSRE